MASHANYSDNSPTTSASLSSSQSSRQLQQYGSTAPNFGEGHRGSDPGHGSPHHVRQWTAINQRPQTQQVPMANGQAQAFGAQHSGGLREGSFTQAQGHPGAYYGQAFGLPTSAQTERYDPPFIPPLFFTPPFLPPPPLAPPFFPPLQSQPTGAMNPLLASLINPVYYSPAPLTPTGQEPIRHLLPKPKPSDTYLGRANLPSRHLSEPKKLLIILDLNGTLLLRSNSGSSYTPRLKVQEFLEYCLANHVLIVWSSARPHNVKDMVAKLFTPEQHAKLVKVWSRDHLRLGAHYNTRVQVYKQLTWLWDDPEVQASFAAANDASTLAETKDSDKDALPRKWDQSNTVLLDDSVDKAASEPYNLIRLDEFTRENKYSKEDVLGRTLAYIDGLKWEADVSSAMREKPFVNGEGAIWDWEKGAVMKVDEQLDAEQANAK